MRWGTLTPVLLTVDSETSLLQITVPQKAGTKVSETPVIKESFFVFYGYSFWTTWPKSIHTYHL